MKIRILSFDSDFSNFSDIGREYGDLSFRAGKFNYESSEFHL